MRKEPVMGKRTAITKYVGLDVHAETISVAVALGSERDRAQALGTIPNRPEAVSRLMRRLGKAQELQVCYEAGPCGYVLYWQLTGLGIACEIVAPTLIPVRAGDRVKTDKRDAVKLAQCLRAGELTSVWVPDVAHEALRDLVRAREAAKKDQLRARHRLGKFLLRQGRHRPQGMKSWTQKHREWLRAQKFEIHAHEATYLDYMAEVDHVGERIARLERAIDQAIEQAPEVQREVVQALQSLRGVAKITAVTLVAEIGSFRRFSNAKQLMAYAGQVPSEHSSGGKMRRGGITKTGNSHLRRVVGETAWLCRLRPNRGYELKKRQQGQSEAIKEVAWKAQHRLYQRYGRLSARGKPKQAVATAVGRELLGFVWAIAVQREKELQSA
jgi:transposase